MGAIISRVAPAPTGFPPLGHVVSALWVWQTADRVLLRIEDHDRQRSRPEFEAAIVEDLDWLGFVPDGPSVRQRDRGDIYSQALETLKRQQDRKSTRLNSSHLGISYAVFCLKKK